MSLSRSRRLKMATMNKRAPLLFAGPPTPDARALIAAATVNSPCSISSVCNSWTELMNQNSNPISYQSLWKNWNQILVCSKYLYYYSCEQWLLLHLKDLVSNLKATVPKKDDGQITCLKGPHSERPKSDISVMRQENKACLTMRHKRDLGMDEPEEKGFWTTTNNKELPNLVINRKWTTWRTEKRAMRQLEIDDKLLQR